MFEEIVQLFTFVLYCIRLEYSFPEVIKIFLEALVVVYPILIFEVIVHRFILDELIRFLDIFVDRVLAILVVTYPIRMLDEMLHLFMFERLTIVFEILDDSVFEILVVMYPILILELIVHLFILEELIRDLTIFVVA